ncbi:MAG: glycosyltransferase, partial [Pseudomonadota bacterium]
EILERWDADLDIWVSEPDRCQAHALNKGFAKAGGEIFGWLCADDELAPGALRRIGRLFAERADVDVITAGCQRDFNEGANRVQTTPDARYYERLDFMNTIEQPSTFWRAASHRAAGKLDETYRYAFDWEFWCRLKRVGARFHAIDDILSVYYFSDDNLTSSGGQKIADEMYRVIKTYGPYQGRIADVYRFLFRTFDMRGYYDADTREQIPKWKRGFFYGVLRALYVPFDRETVNSYNWNFASRQERGLGW